MNLLEIVEWMWPSWPWALPLIGIPCLLFWALYHALEQPVLATLMSEYLQEMHNIEIKSPTSSFARWFVRQYKARPAVYDIIVISSRLFSYGLLILAILTTAAPEIAFIVSIILFFQIWYRRKSPTIKSYTIKLGEGKIEGGFIDEVRRLEILSENDLEKGLDKVLADIAQKESEPNESIRSTLRTIALHNDELGRIARKKLIELDQE
ncbi:MAG: hypothetical protein EAX95_16655 [Candidatus Thorarchaeota archaeon]|nr:hypothetical protein [Candidatus Thorarchaeota archaeon]